MHCINGVSFRVSFRIFVRGGANMTIAELIKGGEDYNNASSIFSLVRNIGGLGVHSPGKIVIFQSLS